MDVQPPQIRVIVRLPFNRPEEHEAFAEPPQIEWNSEKEQLLWEVIAKSRVTGGGVTDWKGLASHLQVPLPYLLYRAQIRYEEDLRGLRTALSPASPAPQVAAAKTGSPPAPSGGEYFPKVPTQDKVAFPRKDSLRAGHGPLAASSSGRPLTIRTRLNSLGNAHRSISSPQKVTSSSVITLQGPKRTHVPLRLLSPTLSRPSPSSPSSGADGGDEDEEEEEEMRRYEEEEKRIEEQQDLERKLRELEQKLTKETIGLVSSPPKPTFTRGRIRPLSSSSMSSSLHQRLDFSRAHSASHTPSHHSLSSASSPQGSIPDIPSPPPESRSQPSSPMARHLSPGGPSRSPPAVSHGNAWGTTARGPTGLRRATIGANGRSDRGSEIGSTASSFSDLSDASLSSALGSSLMSNMRGQSSRLSNLGPRKPSAR